MSDREQLMSEIDQTSDVLGSWIKLPVILRIQML